MELEKSIEETKSQFEKTNADNTASSKEIESLKEQKDHLAHQNKSLEDQIISLKQEVYEHQKSAESTVQESSEKIKEITELKQDKKHFETINTEL